MPFPTRSVARLAPTARRALSLVSLLWLALHVAALGGCAQSIAAAQGTTCGDVYWGGYAGEPRCAALAQRIISGADRSCTADADCALVHPGASCREQCVARAHLSTYSTLPAACTHPAGGPCPTPTARCVDGCCVTGH